MQNFAAIRLIVLGLGLTFPGVAPAADAAPVQVFDVGYGWDAGFAYASPDGLAGAAKRESGKSLRAGRAEAAEPGREASSRTPAAVPVPGSLVLFGGGLAALAVAGRRRSPRRPA